MAKFDVKALNYITCGSKQNTFNIEYRYTDDGMVQGGRTPAVNKTLSTSHTNTFFGDVGTNETMKQSFATNKASFYDVDKKMLIHGLYSLTKTKMRSTAKKLGMNADNIDVYVPSISNDLIGMCQLQDYAYGLTREMEVAPVHRDLVFNSSTCVDVSYHYQLSSDDLKTYLYPTLKDLTNDIEISTYELYVTQHPELSSTRISSVFSPSRNLSGINYNYLIELPLGTIQNKYEKGYIQCDMAVTKCPHNYLYSIDISSDDYNIEDCREYVNIGACGDLAYLTYRTNVRYDNSKKVINYYDNLNTEYDSLSNEVIDYEESRQQAKDTYTYQHVEVIESINRFDGSLANTSGHKSSLFSIRLNDTGLNESTVNDTTKQMLRQNIANNIRKIAEKICPANTQLFNVYFEGD